MIGQIIEHMVMAARAGIVEKNVKVYISEKRVESFYDKVEKAYEQQSKFLGIF